MTKVSIRITLSIYVRWQVASLTFPDQQNCKSCPWTVAFHLVLQSDLSSKDLQNKHTPSISLKHLHLRSHFLGHFRDFLQGRQRIGGFSPLETNHDRPGIYIMDHYIHPWLHIFSPWNLDDSRWTHQISSLALFLRSALPLWIAWRQWRHASPSVLMEYTPPWKSRVAPAKTNWRAWKNDPLPFESLLSVPAYCQISPWKIRAKVFRSTHQQTGQSLGPSISLNPDSSFSFLTLELFLALLLYRAPKALACICQFMMYIYIYMCDNYTILQLHQVTHDKIWCHIRDTRAH